MNSFDNDDRKENFNLSITSTQTRILRRNSILKTTDFDSKLMEEITSDETTRIRKSRRVSFSQKIQVKTIDELNSKPNDSITEANTKANARASITRSDLKKLNDVTNKIDTHDVSVLPGDSAVDADPLLNTMNSTNIECVSMEISGEMDLVITDDHDKSLEKTFEESVLLMNVPNDKQNETLSVSMDSPQASPLKTPVISLKDKTYDLIEGNTTIKVQLNEDINDVTQFKINETIQGINNRTYQALQEPSMINKTFDLERTQANKTMDIEPDTLKLPSQSFMSQSSASFIQSTMVNRSNINLSVLNETVSNCADLLSSNTQNWENEMEMLMEKCIGILDKIKLLKSKVIEDNRLQKNEIEKIQNENQIKQTEIDKKRSEVNKMRQDIDRIKMNASSDPKMIKLLTETQYNSKRQNEIKNLLEKNKNNEKEVRDAKKKLDNLKDSVDVGFDQIKSLRNERNEKEKLLKLYKTIFDDSVLDFDVTNFDEDTIGLSFFNSSIQVQIKATNLVSDLCSKVNIDLNESIDISLEDLNKKWKYLNYPIKLINIKSNVDAYGNKMRITQSRMSLSNKYSKNKVPLFVRYCINLVLGEFKLDQDGNVILAENKIKFVRDLPIFIARLKCACSCAINLARDLEEIIAKTDNSFMKIDFDLKNYVINFCLPEDGCFYNLRLNVEPGSYYQVPIEFKIDQNDLDEAFEPNVGKISKMLEDQYFENGSMKNYFKKLNVF